ncbi:MAG: hypothetical protein NTW30_06130 [Candidatus Aenigmarchaeota archaeon]|nr:hypothetical protein [Candidatus Aenigmarchaeota archaeon]
MNISIEELQKKGQVKQIPLQGQSVPLSQLANKGIKIVNTQPVAKPQPEQGLISKVAGGIGERLGNIWNIGTDVATGKTSGPEGMLRGVGEAAAGAVGVVTDVAGAGIKTLYENKYTPEERAAISQSAAHILDTSVGRAGIEALKQGAEVYQKWAQENPNASKDLEAFGNILSVIPAGKVAGEGLKVAEDLTTGVRKSASELLKESAKKDVAQALAPITKENKILTKKLTPEFQKQGIVGSRESILKKATEGVQKFGKAIEDYIGSGKLTGIVPKEKIFSAIDEFAKGAMTKGGVVIDEEKVKLADSMRGIMEKFGDSIPAEEAKSALRVLGEMTARKKGFTTGGEKLSAQLEKDIYGSIARELAKENPVLDNLNKSFTFYKDLKKVTQETIDRTKPQSGMLRKAASVIFAGEGTGGVLDNIIRYTGSKIFLDFVSGPFYKTLSSKIKTGISSALYSGDTKKVDDIINSVKSGVTPELPKKPFAESSSKVQSFSK